MYSLEDDIENYIDCLASEYELSISLHFNGGGKINERFLKYNLHCNSYCLFLKSNPELWKYCISRQYKIYDKLQNGSFFGMCHAGVYEFVYPIYFQQKIFGFISVSGYRKNNNITTVLNRLCEKYDFSREELIKIYNNELKEEIPSASVLDKLIHPLCHMLELMYEKNPSRGDSGNNLYNKIINYLHLHHTEKISIDDLCRQFYCSRSSVSHLFKSINGMSVTEYVTMLRMEDSKRLLKNTDLSIAAISSNLGFSDSNYFSNVFKKHFGISPLRFRKKERG